MKFTIWPTRADRKARANGVERTGQELSAAPGGIWIVPYPRIEGDPTAFLGHKGRDPGGQPEVYVIKTDL